VFDSVKSDIYYCEGNSRCSCTALLRRGCAVERGQESLRSDLGYAELLACGEDAALGLFLAEECLSAGVTPTELMHALGFDPGLVKYSPHQPRVPAGSGRESGRWTSGGAGGSEGVSGNIIFVGSSPHDNTTMLFGDAKKMVEGIVRAAE